MATSPVLGGRTNLNTIATVLSVLLGIAAVVLTLPYLLNGNAEDEGNVGWSWAALIVGVLTIAAAAYYFRAPRNVTVVVILSVLLLILGFLTVWTWVGPLLAIVTVIIIAVAYTRRNRVIDR